jgi:hypothetical protein
MKEWIKGIEGRNMKFKRETLLNYAANRWALNKKVSVDAVSFLIRKCSPKNFEEWKKFYFENATQGKKNGLKITEEYIKNLGKKLFLDISDEVKSELNSITEEECIDYMFNLVLNRTFEGYMSEIQVIYGELQKVLGVKIEQAPDEWDRIYNVDYFIKVNNKYIGIQIKPIESGTSLNDYQWIAMQEKTHKRFKDKFGGSVFFVYSVKAGSKKVIFNKDVIDKIKEEIKRLS